MDPTNIVISIIVLAGTLSTSYASYKSSRNATRVGLEANAFQRAVAAEEKAEAANSKMVTANQRADSLDRRLQNMERNMVSLESRLRYIILLIHDPYMSLELLRERVPLNFNTAGKDHD